MIYDKYRGKNAGPQCVKFKIASVYGFISLHKMHGYSKFNSLLFGPLCLLYDQMHLLYGIMHSTIFSHSVIHIVLYSSSCTRVPKTTEREREREVLIRSIAKQDIWPREKSELVNKYLKHFTQFINSIAFDEL
jgi:hypothetical protein